MPLEDDEKNLDKAFSSAQLEKLQLEVKHLKNKGKWTDRITPYTSLFSVIIAVSGFIFGVIQFNIQQDAQIQEREKLRINQERELKAKLQERFKVNLDKLLSFTLNEQIGPPQVKLLLLDVKDCIRLRATYESKFLSAEEKTKESEKDIREVNEREVTEMLVQLLVYSCDFNNTRHLNISGIILNDWPDMGTYFHEEHYFGYLLLNKHNLAFSRLYRKDPKVVSNISYDDETDSYEFSNGTRFNDEDEDNFVQLATNFIYLYRPIADTDENLSNDRQPLVEFEEAIGNKNLAKEMFSSDFEMKSKTTSKDRKIFNEQ